MPKRLDESAAIAAMRNANFEPLEPYSLSKTPWKSKCLQCENVCYPILSNIKSGKRGCTTCGSKESGRKTSIRKRMPKNELDQILSDKSVELLSAFETTKDVLLFRCLLCGEEFFSQVRYIQKFKLNGCPECRKTIPKVKKNYPPKTVFRNVKEIAKSRGFETESQEARNEDLVELTCFRCRAEYRKKLVTLKESNFACVCVRKSAQDIKGAKYLELAQEYAGSRNGKVLSVSISRKMDRVVWECNKGHRWEQPVGVVLSNQSWCKDCAGLTPRTLAQLEVVVTARGGKLLSRTYTNVDSMYDFECSIGHKFSNAFKHVVNGGQWCPRCNKGSKSEEICRTTFEQITGREFDKARPKWLRNSRNRQMEIDGYCESLKIGFEYQGIQHSDKSIYGHSIPQRIEDDKLKAELCKEHGIALFIIDYKTKYSEFVEEIKSQATAFGINTSDWNFEKEIDLNLAYIRNDRLIELKELLEPKQIEVLSTKWIAVDTEYEFLCKVCNHRWVARGNSFFNSRNTTGCKKCAMKNIAGANRLDLEAVQGFAAKFGGECLSTDYVQVKYKYRFKCIKGHIFEDNFNNMKFRNTFCPTCEGRNVKHHLSDSEALQLLRSYNLEPTAPRPKWATQGWPAICLVCNEEVSTSLQHLIERESPCKYCSGASISEKKTREVFALANLEPIEPFKTGTAPWKSKCLVCGAIVNGRYSNLVKGQSGCRTCYFKRKKG